MPKRPKIDIDKTEDSSEDLDLKVGDNVRVITGSNKGKEGKVLKLYNAKRFPIKKNEIRFCEL